MTQKEVVNEIIFLWQNGEHEAARLVVKLYSHILDTNICKYLYEKTNIINKEKIHKILFEAQNIMGGKIFNQYGVEVDDPRIKKSGTRPVFKI
jgi:hypothetical protein